MEKDSGYIGKLVGSYQIVRALGRGSFGSVYLANHRYLHRTVAIKILHSNYSNSPKEQAEFFQEAQFLDALKHPHILPLLDVGMQDGFIYMMLEYAPHDSLQARIEKHYPARLSMKETFLILNQIGQALQYAHTYKYPIVHRDVKPANILFNDKGDALLADFGIAARVALVDASTLIVCA